MFLYDARDHLLMVPLELVAHGVLLVLLLPRVLWHGLQAKLRLISGVLALTLRGGDEARAELSCPIPVRQAPSTSFACRRHCCHSRVLLRRLVVPTSVSSVTLLQDRALLVRAAFLESPLPSALPMAGSSTGATSAYVGLYHLLQR